ncbi:TPR-like protein, partial [Lanmaoa asiatica]
LHSRANSLVTRSEQGGGTNYIDEAVVLDREALDLCPPGHPERHGCLNNLANHLCDRYDQLGAMMDLEEAIVLDREALELCPPEDSDRSMSLGNLSVHLATRYNQLGEIKDLNEAIILGQDALDLCPPGHPLQSRYLTIVAIHLSTRYNLFGAIEDLCEAITLDRDALNLCPPGHPRRCKSLNNLALHLAAQYKQLGEIENINEAITLAREALDLCPSGHHLRSKSLHNLALHLSTRYDQLGAIADLNEAIILARDSLDLCPLEHPFRSSSLSNLASLLSTQYNQLGAVEDLNKAVVLSRDALNLCPPGHLYRSNFLNGLAIHLSTRYDQLGAIEDLNEAIILGRDALDLCPLGHCLRSRSLNSLANYLSTRYDQFGAIEDLNEAIILARDSLDLCPPGHLHRSISLNNLALRLLARHDRLRAIEDLNEAIIFSRDALDLYPPGHPLRPSSLNNLAIQFSTRYDQLENIEDLNEAIMLGRDALNLCPPGHTLRSKLLNNFARHLSDRYDQLEAIDDLNEAIILARDALDLLPPVHPHRSQSLNNLALRLSTRYTELGAMEDLDEAIALSRDSLALCPPGHSSRSQSLNNLAYYLRTRFTRLSQLQDKEELFSLYTELADVSQMVSFSDLSAAREWIRAAEDFQHPTTLLAYETSFRFLTHHLATLPSLPQHLGILKGLTSSLAVDAFSACLDKCAPASAVELLEQGRGVFWSQLIRLRSPLDDVIASGSAGKTLADEFTRRTSLIHNALDSPGEDQHDRVCRLNVELQGVVSDIRELPGLSRFLLPSFFSDLRQAASEGPIIIVNASEYGCDAFVVFVDQDPVHIPLSIRKKRVRKLSSKLRALTARAKSMNVARDLGLILRQLWDDIVSHIVDVLRKTCPCQSRIWWCPTAEFSLLPLHAAGPYRTGQQNLTDLYISSYTPTLTALIRARRHDPSNSAKGTRFVAIGQAKAIGENQLLSVGTELANIGQRVDGLATFTRIEGQESSISRVAEELSKNEWVHLACHGLPNRKHPFESAFALHDGHFTIERIMRCELENPQFAYLSACHTTVGDKKSPDEVIHLASAMQFAGFRSVIGTMWTVDDGQTNKITSMFYDNMKDESGCLDHTRAAFALHKTMRELDIPFDQRILYIHLGA